ncbi:hypothetical protein [Micromonospora sp. M71_S20]|uniref:hypothetical protein n=1 Tax=Micromonospora sp. M71_S20 TaxID=592872 RepID=UPI001F44AC42|nr:hypothetical protein [Micromonospora sp. M71_S20]
MYKIEDLTKTVFSGLLPLATDDVTDKGERILVQARTPEKPVGYPSCAAVTGRVHGYHQQTLALAPPHWPGHRGIVSALWASPPHADSGAVGRCDEQHRHVVGQGTTVELLGSADQPRR